MLSQFAGGCLGDEEGAEGQREKETEGEKDTAGGSHTFYQCSYKVGALSFSLDRSKERGVAKSMMVAAIAGYCYVLFMHGSKCGVQVFDIPFRTPFVSPQYHLLLLNMMSFFTFH